MPWQDGTPLVAADDGDMLNLWRRWPSWAGRVASVGAVLVTASGVYWGLGGRLGVPIGGAVVGRLLGFAGALAVVAVALRVGWLCWVAAGLLLASNFGLVIDLVMLAGVGYVDDWWGFVAKLERTATMVALAAAALVFHRAARGRCGRCGFAHGDRTPRALRFPQPSAAPAPVRWTAYAGAVAFVPYVGSKAAWALGIPLGGWQGPDLVAGGGFQGLLGRVGLDLTAVLGALGVFLVLALTRPWSQRWPRRTPLLAGRRVPRWLPLVPAFLGASTLAPYGLLGVVAMLVAGPMDTHGAPGWFMVAAMLGFGVPGLAMAVTGWSYLRRTRPRCEPTGADGVSSGSGPVPPGGRSS